MSEIFHVVPEDQHNALVAAARCANNGGLLFSEAEILAFNELAAEAKKARWKVSDFKVAE